MLAVKTPSSGSWTRNTALSKNTVPCGLSLAGTVMLTEVARPRLPPLLAPVSSTFMICQTERRRDLSAQSALMPCYRGNIIIIVIRSSVEPMW